MPRLKVRGKNPEDGGGWVPLPAGTYNIQLDTIEQDISKNGNSQLKIAAHVVDGPHDLKKVTLWYVLVENSLWKLQNLCDAADVDYEIGDLDDTDPETGKPLIEFDFDTDDLEGCIVTFDVTERQYDGKAQNRFENERGPDGADGKSKPDNVDDKSADKGDGEAKAASGNGSDADADAGDGGKDEEKEGPAPAARGRRTRRARA